MKSGEMDRTFGQEGVVTFPAGAMESLEAWPDGSVAALTFDAEGDKNFVYTVHKFTARGVVAADYGQNGVAVIRDARVLKMRAVADGSLVMAAQRSRDDETKLLMRLTPQGRPDAAFGKNGVVDLPGSKSLDFVDMQVGKTTGSLVLLGTADGVENKKIVVKRFLANGSPDASWKDGEVDVDFTRPAWQFLKKPAWMAPVALALEPLLEHLYIAGSLYVEGEPHRAVLKLQAATGGTGQSGHGGAFTSFGPSGLVWAGAGAFADAWVSREDDSVHVFGIDTNPMDKWIALDAVYDRKGEPAQNARLGWGTEFLSAYAPDGRLIVVADREKISWKGLAQPLTLSKVRAIAATPDGKVLVAEQEDGGLPVRVRRLGL